MNLFNVARTPRPDPVDLSSSLFTMALLLIGGLGVRRAVAHGGGVLPDEGVSIRNVIEVVIEA